MDVFEKFLSSVEAATEELTEQEKQDLWQVLHSKLMLKALNGVTGQADRLRQELLSADLTSPLGLAKAQKTQAKIQALIELLNTLYSQAAQPQDKETANVAS